MQHNTAVYLISCPDQKGIVAEVTSFLYRNNGNIISAEQYTDFDERRFFMRVEWELNGFKLSRAELSEGAFEALARKFGMDDRL